MGCESCPNYKKDIEATRRALDSENDRYYSSSWEAERSALLARAEASFTEGCDGPRVKLVKYAGIIGLWGREKPKLVCNNPRVVNSQNNLELQYQ